ncbi:MAG TPA: hypothetical protein VEA59_01700 [Patescibacteria group bacterium]|nr:hypothetical protein [Patescibacteria group bacterium]
MSIKNKFIAGATLAALISGFVMSLAPLAQAAQTFTFPESQGELHITDPQGNLQVFALTGSSTVQVNTELTGAGSDTDDDGLDQVPTELLALHLSGDGAVIRPQPGQRHLGEIEETSNTTSGTLDLPPYGTGTANSFFDVFIELDLPALNLNSSKANLRISGTVTTWPPAPGESLMFTGTGSTAVKLLGPNNQDTGYRLVKLVWSPNPPINPPYRLDHFKCYDLFESPSLQDIVFLFDQFGRTDKKFERDEVRRINFFCNTSRKIHGGAHFGIFDRANHLTWYQIRSLFNENFNQRQVFVRNQFVPNGATLNVRGPAYLAVPTEKVRVNNTLTNYGFPKNLDHFKCYDVNGPQVTRNIRVQDEFDRLIAGLPFDDILATAPKYLCNPTYKIHITGFSAAGTATIEKAEIRHPEDHLVCYDIRKEDGHTRRIQTFNQFGTHTLSTKRFNHFCVPSLKREVNPVPTN